MAPTARSRSAEHRSERIDRRRGLALAGAGALGALVLLAGAGMLSQLDFGASGAEPTAPGLVITTAPPSTATPQPKEEGEKGKGNCNGRGKHCDGGGGSD